MSVALTTTQTELARYVQEVSRYPVLNRDEEVRLARAYRDEGDVSAAHQLVVSNLRFVVKVAYEFRGYGMTLLDLVQEGNIGLMKAVQKFDPEKGYRLISYAVWWIRAQIQTFVVRSWSLVKMGSGHVSRKLFFKLRSERSKAWQENAGALNSEELAERLQVSETDIDEMEARMAARDFSLDAPKSFGERGQVAPVDLLAAPEANQETQALAAEDKAIVSATLEKAKGKLNDKEQFILENRLLTDDPMTLAEVGEHYGVTRERARQIEAKVLEKLRAALPSGSVRKRLPAHTPSP